MTSRRLPRFTRFYRRLVLRAQRHHDDHQRQVNAALAQAVSSLVANDRRLLADVGGAVSISTSIRSDLRRILSEHGRALGTLMAQRPTAEARLSELADQSDALTASLNDLILQLRAIPYLSDPSMLETRDDAGRPAIGFGREVRERGHVHPNARFEDVFRGSEDFIRSRQRVYLPHLIDHDPVVDVGCGRGEMLDLLAEVGVSPLVSISISRWSSAPSEEAYRFSSPTGSPYLHEQQEVDRRHILGPARRPS